MFSGCSDGWMFYRGNDYVAAVRLRGLADAQNGQVVCFGASGGEDNFIGPGADKRGYLSSCPVYSRARLLAHLVHAGRVAKLFGEVRQHCLNDSRVNRCRGAMIEINFTHL